MQGTTVLRRSFFHRTVQRFERIVKKERKREKKDSDDKRARAARLESKWAFLTDRERIMVPYKCRRRFAFFGNIVGYPGGGKKKEEQGGLGETSFSATCQFVPRVTNYREL